MPSTPATLLGKRLRRIREAAGFGEPGKAAQFARKLVITPASLHDLESGKSQELGGKAWRGYLSVGANPLYILHGKGTPMLKDLEKNLRAQTLVTMMLELGDRDLDTLEDIIKTYLRAKIGPKALDPPTGNGTEQ